VQCVVRHKGDTHLTTAVSPSYSCSLFYGHADQRKFSYTSDRKPSKQNSLDFHSCQITIFRNKTPCSFFERQLCFGQTCYLHLQGRRISLYSTPTQKTEAVCSSETVVESSWNVIAHGDARERKWRGNCRMEWVASTLHTTSKHGVSSITTVDAHTSAASSRLNWRPRRFKWTRPFRRKTKSGFCACHHISKAVYLSKKNYSRIIPEKIILRTAISV
jgi:hypothetical protein